MRDLICRTTGADPAVLDFPIHLIDTARLSINDDMDDPALRILLEALQAGAQGTMQHRYETIMRTFTSMGNDLRARYLLGGFFHYAGALCHPARCFEIAKNMAYRLFGVTEGNKMANTFLDEMLEKGEAKGKAEGKIEAILSVLGVRFGSVPEPVVTALEKCTEVERLDKLVLAAVTCTDIGDFQQRLGL